jgi:hypothetical protein
MSDLKQRFLKAVDALEEQLNEGFFLSFINKIVVDEKKIFTIINELRSMATESFEYTRAEPVAGTAIDVDPVTPPIDAPTAATISGEALLECTRRESEAIRRDAHGYAEDMLIELESNLTRALNAVREGRDTLAARNRNPGGNS